MTVPVLRLGRTLIVTLPSAVSDTEMLELQDRLAEEVGELGIRGVVLDVSVVDVLDSFATRTLRGIAQTVRLRGARAVIVGVRPEVAFSMVRLGLTLEDVPTALDLEEALDHLDRATGGGTGRGR
ncbi:MAG TPA: STAS domain-containing protein [Actinomycetota bacterium]|nr:STAS domain-containing protein [Actinomycetota bacterium]